MPKQGGFGLLGSSWTQWSKRSFPALIVQWFHDVKPVCLGVAVTVVTVAMMFVYIDLDRPSRAADTWDVARILKNCCKYLFISYWLFPVDFHFSQLSCWLFFGMSAFEVQRQQLVLTAARTSEISQLRSKTCSLSKTLQYHSWDCPTASSALSWYYIWYLCGL